MQRRDFAAIAHRNSEAVELAHEVVRHRLPQVGSPMKQRHQRSAASQPDRRLARRVSAADYTDSLGTAELALDRSRGEENADSFVLVEVLDRQPPVLCA